MEERLAELDEEREELAKYRQVDKERRSLEYTIYDKDLHETRLNLEKVFLVKPEAPSYCATCVKSQLPASCMGSSSAFYLHSLNIVKIMYVMGHFRLMCAHPGV